MVTLELAKRVELRQLTRPLVERLVKAAERVVKFPQPFSLSLAVVSDREIRRINRQYRHKDKPTDVLSFRYDENTGEILISADRVRAQAKEYRNTITEEAAWMVVHGILHILGWDHERSAKEYAEQRQLEQKILKKCQFKSAR